MDQALVDRVVNAVLYEGYVVYPYRPPGRDRPRWTFSGLYPRAFAEVHGGTNAWAMQTECLVCGDDRTRIHITVRFLHPSDRRVRELDRPVVELSDGPEPAGHAVEWAQIGDRLLLSGHEAEERQQPVGEFPVAALATRGRQFDFHFPAGRTVEPVRGPTGDVLAVLVRERHTLSGRIAVAAEPVSARLFRVRVRLENRSALADAARRARDEALMRALVAPHTVLGVRGGAFVSLIDPPEEHRAAAAACQNIGTWPVLIGAAGATDTMLSAPVILYDYPAVVDAPEGSEVSDDRTLPANEEPPDARMRAFVHQIQSLTEEEAVERHDGPARARSPDPDAPDPTGRR